MAETLPRTVSRILRFANGEALGISNRWEKGQYCTILTPAGLVGCGIYDLETPAEFGQAIAIARGTPAQPLTEPEDLLDARIVGVTPQAEAHGIRTGMTGREAVELLLKASPGKPPLAVPASPPGGSGGKPRVLGIDHVTLIVKDLDRSRRFYTEVLGMTEVARPAFSFAGAWFQAGVTLVHLTLEHDKTGPAGNPLPEARRSGRTPHFAFNVEDAEAFAALARARQVPIVGEPAARPDGYVQVFVTDPDGHVIELCSPPASL